MNYIVISGDEAVVRADRQPLSQTDFTQLCAPATAVDRFDEASTEIAVMALPKDCELPEAYDKISIRQIFAEADEESATHYARAKALIGWRKNSRYCGCCGSEMQEHPTLTARQCPQCGNLVFPRIEPCIIVLVTKGEEILLARHVQRNQNIYACIAGFMEAGENAEQAVRREIMEETGLTVKNIRYFGSQSWPFPAQLMLGFTAEYESGELRLQEEELSDAQWFRRDNCPASPRPGSIAYRLIHNLKC